MAEPYQLAPGVWRLGRAADRGHHSYLLSLSGEGTPSEAPAWVWVDPGDSERFPEIADQVLGLVGDLEELALVVATGLGASSVGALPAVLERSPGALLLTNQETWSFLSVTDVEASRVRLIERFRPGLRLANGRRLEVIVNPYGQFTGAVLLFDPTSGCLLSGDLLAGDGEEHSSRELFATAEDWPSVRRHQQRWMPCNAALRWTLGRVRRLGGLRMVCPRSGPLLRGPCLETFLDRLEGLPVGADLLASTEGFSQGPDLVLDGP